MSGFHLIQKQQKKWVIGNWKMYGRRVSLVSQLAALQSLSTSYPPHVQVVLCPPAIYLSQALDLLAETGVFLGAQDVCDTYEDGARTGDVSAAMLSDIGVRCVLVGHSERRTLHGETSEQVAKKALTAREAGLIPIVCVGETSEQRQSGRTALELFEQLSPVLNTLAHDEALSNTHVAEVEQQQPRVMIAYEPVWAIGTGKTADLDTVIETVHVIRDACLHMGPTLGDIPILYGGSVQSHNAGLFLSHPEIDGVLVGSASLKMESLTDIVLKSGV